MLSVLPFLLIAGSNSAVQAGLPFVSPMFSDNMVIQRNRSDPVWGWTVPGEVVTVSIGEQTVSATAGKDRKWMARVGPFGAGGPYVLSVTTIGGVEAAPRSTSFQNVMVGDVWVCSGQSNMEFGIGNLVNPGPEIAAGNYPNIRLFYLPHQISASPSPIAGGAWQPCTPDSLRTAGDWGGFSAVAYYFGRKLNQDLRVPIGLVHTSWGGTVAEAWTSEAALKSKMPEFRAALSQLVQARKSGDDYANQLSAWYKRNDLGTQANPAWSEPSMNDSSWKTMNLPGFFQNAGIPELINQQSVVWFRKTVEISDGPTEGVTLHLLADDSDVTWVNGTQIGATAGYNVPRAYKIPAGVLHRGYNVIAVRVTDVQAPGGIYGEPAGPYLELPGDRSISLNGSWRVKLSTAISQNNPLPASLQDNPNFPTVLYNGMIYPIAPMAIKGAIWYQGESNGDRGYQYRRLLPAMIESWRDTFRQGAFPFLVVQLAGFGQQASQPGDDAWAELREAQWLTSQSMRNVGIATAIDIGDSLDIHPKNKQELGRRLGLVAESQVYGQHVVSSGPVYKAFKIEGSSIRVRFDHTEGGLRSRGDGPPRFFAVAGADRKWHWAEARIDRDSVLVSSPEVQAPVAVRYSWAAYSTSNLVNGVGLPAFPFRTDQWTLGSQK